MINRLIRLKKSNFFGSWTIPSKEFMSVTNEKTRALKGYFDFLDKLGNNDRKIIQKERAQKIADEDLDIKHCDWEGGIDNEEVKKKLESQSRCNLCDKLMFFGDLYYNKSSKAKECSRMAKDIVTNKYDMWLQGHIWKDFVEYPPYMNHHYGNYARLLAQTILEQKTAVSNSRIKNSFI